MRDSYMVTVVAAGFASLPLFAQPADIAPWSATGRDLYEKCVSPDETVAHACGEYLLGLLDGVVMSMPTDAQLVCPPRSLSFFQLEVAYLNWGKANPELLDRSRGIAAAAALSAAFPCPKR
jgi:Rap1a immunity proteins